MTKARKNVCTFLCCVLFAVCTALAFILLPARATTAKAAAPTTDVMYCSGVGIRLNADDKKNGIRFHVRVTADKDGNVTFEDGTYTKEEFFDLTKGILVIPADKLSDAEELTIEGAETAYDSGAKAANPSDLVWSLQSKENGEETEYFYQSSAYVYNIPDTSYDRDFIFRGYYYNENEEQYVYSNTKSSSVSDVAFTAKQADLAAKEKGEEGYQGELLECLNSFLPVRISPNANLKNRESYIYRVGNQNAVAFDSLFTFDSLYTAESEGKEIPLKDVSVEKLEGSENVSVSYQSANSGNGSFSFQGTGIIKFAVKEAYSRESAVLVLEVVDAVNATKATNATNNNVVLLNDITATSINISNGYAFYANGFKITFTGDGAYKSAALSYGFITIQNGGVLDNARVICNIFPKSYMYTSEMTKGSNDNYPYGYSAVVVSGNSMISNSYIYGARNNIMIGNGNVIIENTVVECGSLSNIQIKSTDAHTVTLKDVTTIQYVTTSEYDTSKKVLGFGVLVGDSESNSNPSIKLEGTLVQYNWVTEQDTEEVSNEYAKQAIKAALNEVTYQHTDKGGNTTVNMGIVYLNEAAAAIEDNRADKATLSYKLSKISIATYIGQVYSISGGTVLDDKKVDYIANANGYVMPTVAFTDTNNAISFSNEYDTNVGAWTNVLSLDLDNVDGGSYDLSFNKVAVNKYGEPLTFDVKDAEGKLVDKNTGITFNQLDTEEYTLVVTDDRIYDASGKLTEESKTIEIPFTVKATKTSIEPPKFSNAETATAIRLVSSKGGDWRPAYTALTGVSVTYWSASEGKVKTIDLSKLYNSGTISSNVWTYTCDDYTLTITGGAVHTDGTAITPVVANNTLYFASTNKTFGTGTTSRNIILTYVFTDKNASTTWNRTETVTYSDLEEYDYNSFKNNGTLTEPSSNPSCLAEGTLITLADGRKERVENLRKGDLVMSFDHVTGTLTASRVIIVVKTQSEFYKNTFIFDDGTALATINEHGIFDLNLNKYVNIDHENYQDYLGHDFVSVDVNGNIGTKKLIDVTSVYGSGYKYDIVTEQTLNYVAEDTLSVTHVLVDIINTFAFGAELRYDQRMIQEDVEKYGLYDYDEWKEYCDISVFEEYNIPVMKIGVSKGYYTKEYIISLINTYVLDESVQIIG